MTLLLTAPRSILARRCWMTGCTNRPLFLAERPGHRDSLCLTHIAGYLAGTLNTRGMSALVTRGR